MKIYPIMTNVFIHKHDCESCLYLGSVLASYFEASDMLILDMYYCPKGEGSLIARYGSDGDYSSWPVDIINRSLNPIMYLAYRMAKEYIQNDGRELNHFDYFDWVNTLSEKMNNRFDDIRAVSKMLEDYEPLKMKKTYQLHFS